MKKFFTLIVLVLGILFYFFADEYSLTDFFLYFFLFINICSLLLYIYSKEKYDILQRQTLKISTVFLVGFIIVFFQPYIDMLFGYIPLSHSVHWVNDTVALKSLTLITIAFNAFFLGRYFYREKRQRKTSTGEIQVTLASLNLLKLTNFFFLILFLSQLKLSFFDSTLYGSSEERISPLGSYSMLFFDCSFIAILIMTIKLELTNSSKSHLSFLKFLRRLGYSAFLFGCYLTCILLSGDRGPIISLSMALFATYLIISREIYSKSSIAIFLLISTLLISALGIIRSGVSYTDIDLRVGSRYYPQSISPSTKELASSSRTLNVAVNSVPDKYPYFLGLFTVQNFTVLVPGLNSFINKEFAIPREHFSSPRFLTYLDLGPNATWGVGSSSIADVYLDFGWLGIALFFFTFGYYIRHLEINVIVFQRRDFAFLAFYILYFGFAIYISRSNLLVPLTKIAYVATFYYLSLLITKKKSI